MKSRKVGVTAVVVLLVSAAACRSTQFPDNPEAHRLYLELEQAPHPYYFNVRNGVKSHVLGMRAPDGTAAVIAQIREIWSELDALDTTAEILNVLETRGPDGLSERIIEVIGRAESPPGGADPRLEAGAVKQGLVDAAYEFKRETGGRP